MELILLYKLLFILTIEWLRFLIFNYFLIIQGLDNCIVNYLIWWQKMHVLLRIRLSQWKYYLLGVRKMNGRPFETKLHTFLNGTLRLHINLSGPIWRNSNTKRIRICLSKCWFYCDKCFFSKCCLITSTLMYWYIVGIVIESIPNCSCDSCQLSHLV